MNKTMNDFIVRELGGELIRQNELIGPEEQELNAWAWAAEVNGQIDFQVVPTSICYAGLTRSRNTLRNRMEAGDDVKETLITFVHPAAEIERFDEFGDVTEGGYTKVDFGFTDRDLRTYYYWVLNKSPWARAFVTKSATQIIQDHYVVMNVNAPSNFILAGLSALRQTWEYRTIPETFIYLKRKLPQVDRDFLFAVSHMLFKNKTGGFTRSIRNSNHTPLQGDMCTKTLYNLIRHDHQLINPPLKDTDSLRGMDSMFVPDPKNYSSWGDHPLSWAEVTLYPALEAAATNTKGNMVFGWNKAFNPGHNVEAYSTFEHNLTLRVIKQVWNEVDHQMKLQDAHALIAEAANNVVEVEHVTA